MNTLIVCTTLVLLGTKALDCLSTLLVVRTPPAETNPIARRVMQWLGLRRATLLVFALTAACACSLAAVAMLTQNVVYQVLFAFVGLFVSTVQAAVAHTNWTGRWNAITRCVLRCHQGMSSWAQQHLAGRGRSIGVHSPRAAPPGPRGPPPSP